jgi:hypothetical protein
VSRRRRPLRLLPQSKATPNEEAAVAVATPHTADGSVEDTLPRRRAFAELLELARRPLIDEPARRGGVDMHDGEDAIPERVSETESPLDLAKRTQARRERVRRESTPPADHLPDGSYLTPDGRGTLVVQRSLAAAAMAQIRRHGRPRWVEPGDAS